MDGIARNKFHNKEMMKLVGVSIQEATTSTYHVHVHSSWLWSTQNILNFVNELYGKKDL
jgi:hypothetical protein